MAIWRQELGLKRDKREGFKKHEETLQGYRFVHYLDCGDVSKGIQMSNLINLCTSKVYNLLYASISQYIS